MIKSLIVISLSLATFSQANASKGCASLFKTASASKSPRTVVASKIEFSSNKQQVTLTTDRTLISFISDIPTRELLEIFGPEVLTENIKPIKSQGKTKYFNVVAVTSKNSKAISNKIHQLQEDGGISFPSYGYKSSEGGLSFTTGQIIVRFNKALSKKEIEKFETEFNVKFVEKTKFLPKEVGEYRFEMADSELNKSQDQFDVVSSIDQLDSVVYASPDFISSYKRGSSR